jgi:hypothetical protein
MTNKVNAVDKFTISLRENGLHSLWRGIELYGIFDKAQDKLILKDAIIFLHHGVELLMKEILVKTSPFLIFEDLRDAAAKQKRADESGLGIFFIDKPPKTVTYEEAIKRVSAFIKPKELNDDLQADLDKLNCIRNQLEHYAIDVDKEDVVRLLAALQGSLLQLFENSLGGVLKNQPVKVSQVWEAVQDSNKQYFELENRVINLVHRFNGQRVPGFLFNFDGEFTLPMFQNVLMDHRVLSEGKQYRADIYGEGPGVRWVIEVKGNQRASLSTIAQVSSIGNALNAQAWLIVFTDVNDMEKALAKTYGVLITGENEWNELEQMLSA